MTNQMRNITICAVGLLLLTAGPALAHKVNVFGYAEGDKLMGQAYFSGGNPARNCKVLLLDHLGKEIDNAKTGVDGAFEMKLPKAEPPLKLVVVAGEGHQGQFVVKAEDLGLAQSETKPKADEQPGAVTADRSPIADLAQFEKAVARVVEQKIAPLRVQISRMAAEKPSEISQIIGGIGWIIGLVGVAAFFVSRRRGKKQG